MRKLTLALSAASALITMAAVSTQALAMDYPYCLQGRQTGYPGECSYQSYQQCQASASGRDAVCGINPRVAYNQQRGGRNHSSH
jgi:Spy/CpxP family protein refolding chaperone